MLKILNMIIINLEIELKRCIKIGEIEYNRDDSRSPDADIYIEKHNKKVRRNNGIKSPKK